MSPILSETFAPPKMATNGRSGLSKAVDNASISFCTKKPEALSK